MSLKSYATNIYQSHVTIDANTIDKGSFSYKMAPGASITQNVLISSLSYGLFERVEFGTIPIFYFNDIHKYNLNCKYNFFSSDTLSISLGFSHLKFDLTKEPSTIENPPTEFTVNFISLSLNHDIPNTSYYTGITFNRASAYANNSAFLDTYAVNDEWALDFGKKINGDYSLTFGIGEHKIEINEPENSFGLGGTLIITKNLRYFSNLAIGIQYLKDTKSALYLFSADL